MADTHTFAFRVMGLEEQVGDALNELINRSAMWEGLDQESSFTIEFVGMAAP